jgi:hypothetical protein
VVAGGELELVVAGRLGGLEQHPLVGLVAVDPGLRQLGQTPVVAPRAAPADAFRKPRPRRCEIATRARPIRGRVAFDPGRVLGPSRRHTVQVDIDTTGGVVLVEKRQFELGIEHLRPFGHRARDIEAQHRPVTRPIPIAATNPEPVVAAEVRRWVVLVKAAVTLRAERRELRDPREIEARIHRHREPTLAIAKPLLVHRQHQPIAIAGPLELQRRVPVVARCIDRIRRRQREHPPVALKQIDTARSVLARNNPITDLQVERKPRPRRAIGQHQILLQRIRPGRVHHIHTGERVRIASTTAIHRRRRIRADKGQLGRLVSKLDTHTLVQPRGQQGAVTVRRIRKPPGDRLQRVVDRPPIAAGVAVVHRPRGHLRDPQTPRPFKRPRRPRPQPNQLAPLQRAQVTVARHTRLKPIRRSRLPRAGVRRPSRKRPHPQQPNRRKHNNTPNDGRQTHASPFQASQSRPERRSSVTKPGLVARLGRRYPPDAPNASQWPYVGHVP